MRYLLLGLFLFSFKYDKIVNYKNDDFVSYNCSDSLYGFVITEGTGIIRYFPPNAPTQD